MSMISTDMSMDMHKLLMEKSFLYLRNTLEMFWKELHLQSTPIFVFQKAELLTIRQARPKLYNKYETNEMLSGIRGALK